MAFKKLAAMKKMKGLKSTFATCEDMITDFKTLLTSPEGIQYWDAYLETV